MEKIENLSYQNEKIEKVQNFENREAPKVVFHPFKRVVAAINVAKTPNIFRTDKVKEKIDTFMGVSKLKNKKVEVIKNIVENFIAGVL